MTLTRIKGLLERKGYVWDRTENQLQKVLKKKKIQVLFTKLKSSIHFVTLPPKSYLHSYLIIHTCWY